MARFEHNLLTLSGSTVSGLPLAAGFCARALSLSLLLLRLQAH
jgi:hypothetical protein